MLPTGLKLGLSLSGIFDFFTFGVAEATSWNCGGVLLILSPLFVIAGVSVLIAILAKDILLFFAISIEKYKGRVSFVNVRFVLYVGVCCAYEHVF